MKVLTEADGIVCPRTIAGKYLSIVEPDNRSLAAVDRVIAALEPVRDLRLLTDKGPWGNGSESYHGALPIYRIWRDGPLVLTHEGQFRIPGHAIEEVFVALSCWADGARAGRFAAAELKVDVMAKEFQGMDMVVPRDAASFPSAPSRRHLVHAGTTRRLTGRAVGPIARRPRASSRRSPRSGGRRKPIRGTSMQPPGKYGAPVVSRKSGPVRLLSCQFTHAPNKAPTTTPSSPVPPAS